MLQLDDISVLPKMRGLKHSHKVFKLLWVMDLKSCCDSQVVKLLFHTDQGNHYLTDTIAPEYLSYFTVGSFFKNGKRLQTQSSSEIYERTIASSAKNEVRTISSAMSGTGLNLNYGFGSPGGSIVDFSIECLNQRCLLFVEGIDNVVIPCAVVASTYYFTSPSMRSQVLAQNLNGLFEGASVDPSTGKAQILLKPNAKDDDAFRIARFAINPHAKKCWDNVLSTFRTLTKLHTKVNSLTAPLVAQIPVIQKISIKVRGEELANAAGGSTLLVHEIISENSDYPFCELNVFRRRREHLPESEVVSISRLQPIPDGNIVETNPARDYGYVKISAQTLPLNFNDHDIVLTKSLVPPLPSPGGDDRFKVVHSGKETVSLNPQMEVGTEDKIAKADLELQPQKEDDCSRINLDEFKEMVSEFQNMEGVSGYKIETVGVWQRPMRRRCSYSLKESYDHTEKRRRQCAVVSFEFEGNHARIVEIDQLELPGGCSTFVLVSADELEAGITEEVMKSYVDNKLSLKDEKEILAKKAILLEFKHHPRRGDDDYQDMWRARVLEIISEAFCPPAQISM